MANYFDNNTATERSMTVKEMIRKKRAEAIAEKVLAGAEVAAWLAGGLAACIVCGTGAGKLCKKLFEGYDEDNPAGLGRTILGAGILVAGTTAGSLAGGFAVEQACDALDDFMDIDIPSENDYFREVLEEAKNKVEESEKSEFDPDKRIMFK